MFILIKILAKSYRAIYYRILTEGFTTIFITKFDEKDQQLFIFINPTKKDKQLYLSYQKYLYSLYHRIVTLFDWHLGRFGT